MSYNDALTVVSQSDVRRIFLKLTRLVSYLDNNCKRLCDISVAVMLLAVLGPALIFIAAMVMWSTGGACIYKHRRVGRNGMPFDCFKFQSMSSNSDRILAEHLMAFPEAAREWSATRKLKIDPRVTRLGRILRMTSIDELPQLFNVLRGVMSCVGPRPIVFAELERYGPSARVYFKARPGLTGLWQVSGRSRLSYADRVALDRHYVLNRSFFVDLAIIVRTVPAIMRLAQTS